MYYVFVLFIGCYRANLQNILLLHLSEAAVSPVWQWLFTKVSRQLHVSENPDSSGRRYGFFSSSCKDSAINVSHVGFILICRAKFLQNPVLQNYLHTSNQ